LSDKAFASWATNQQQKFRSLVVTFASKYGKREKNWNDDYRRLWSAPLK
jgi:hypothetical protein